MGYSRDGRLQGKAMGSLGCRTVPSKPRRPPRLNTELSLKRCAITNSERVSNYGNYQLCLGLASVRAVRWSKARSKVGHGPSTFFIRQFLRSAMEGQGSCWDRRKALHRDGGGRGASRVSLSFFHPDHLTSRALLSLFVMITFTS